MKAIMVMYDSLNRRMLEPYGCDWIRTPNFERLMQHAATFDCNYVGSMPCMPARREIHTGRYNFEHRSWGPIEPFDCSMPEILKNNGIFTYLSTDHYHYWQDGGATYHNRYSACELSRGQEGDAWKVNRELMDFVHTKQSYSKVNHWDRANREYIDCEDKMPQSVTFRAGLDFLDKFHEEDNWFLQIETFDPHEPFFVQKAYKELFPDDYRGDLDDWPPYYFVTEGEDAVQHVRNTYAALITMCDHYLGRVLDKMDEYHLWDDTMLIVNTDHGFLLGEHGWWSKSIMPMYEELARTPLFIWDPRCGVKNERRDVLTQTIDIAPTLLEFFGQKIPEEMEGKPLKDAIARNEKVRDYALFGYPDGHCNITDGTWVYMRAPLDDKPFYEYTLMPTHMARRFSPSELQEIELAGPFSFTKGCRVMKIRAQEGMNHQANFGSLLFNVKEDPAQEHPLDDPEKEAELANEMIALMQKDDCPKERYARFALPVPGENQGGDLVKPDGTDKSDQVSSRVTAEDIRAFRAMEKQEFVPDSMKDLDWEKGASNMYAAIARFLPEAAMGAIQEAVRRNAEGSRVTINTMATAIRTVIPEENQPMIFYFAMLASRTV